MKNRSITIAFACIIWCIAYGCSNPKKQKIQDSPKKVTPSESAQNEIIKEYVKAFDAFAQIMPKFGQDTEAQWAADTVHVMAVSLERSSYSYPQRMAIISQMQNYTAYGMTYFNATIGLYKNSELASYALKMIHPSDSIYNELKKTQFKDVRLLSVFNIASIQNMQLFVALNRLNNDQPMGEELLSTMHALAAMDYITQAKEYTDKEILKISSVMDAFSFFKMIYSLVCLFSGSEEQYNENMVPMVEFAKFVDSQSTPIFNATEDKKKIDVMSDEEHEKWLIKATQYKIDMLRLTTKLIKKWEPTE